MLCTRTAATSAWRTRGGLALAALWVAGMATAGEPAPPRSPVEGHWAVVALADHVADPGVEIHLVEGGLLVGVRPTASGSGVDVLLGNWRVEQESLRLSRIGGGGAWPLRDLLPAAVAAVWAAGDAQTKQAWAWLSGDSAQWSRDLAGILLGAPGSPLSRGPGTLTLVPFPGASADSVAGIWDPPTAGAGDAAAALVLAPDRRRDSLSSATAGGTAEAGAWSFDGSRLTRVVEGGTLVQAAALVVRPVTDGGRPHLVLVEGDRARVFERREGSPAVADAKRLLGAWLAISPLERDEGAIVGLLRRWSGDGTFESSFGHQAGVDSAGGTWQVKDGRITQAETAGRLAMRTWSPGTEVMAYRFLGPDTLVTWNEANLGETLLRLERASCPPALARSWSGEAKGLPATLDLQADGAFRLHAAIHPRKPSVEDLSGRWACWRDLVYLVDTAAETPLALKWRLTGTSGDELDLESRGRVLLHLLPSKAPSTAR